MFRLYLVVLILLSKISYAETSGFTKPSLRFFGSAALDYVDILVDPTWKELKDRYYKSSFLTTGFRFRQFHFGLDLKYYRFNLSSYFQIDGSGVINLGDLYVQYTTLSKNFEALIGQFSHDYCSFVSDANKDKPQLENSLTKTVFFTDSCKGLGARVRYKKYYWAVGASGKFPEITRFKTNEYSAHVKAVLTPLKLDNIFLHLESSFLYHKKRISYLHSSPGIFTIERSQAEIIRSDILPANDISILHFSLQSFLFNRFHIEANGAYYSLSSRETFEIYNKDLVFPSIDASVVYSFGLKRFRYDPFKGFYGFVPTYSRMGIFQFGFTFQLISLIDGLRLAKRGNTGVEGGTQLTYLILLAWKYNEHMKIAANYFLTKTTNVRSVYKREKIYELNDWAREKNRVLSGFSLRLTISF